MTSLKIHRSPQLRSLFPGFFAGGFECSTPINFDRVRIDELSQTGHDAHVRADYRQMRACGMQTARDGIRWNLVDIGGVLDFSSAIAYIQAAEAEKMTVVWDLFHYGYPDDLDPFEPRFIERFSAYCYAFARLLVKRAHGEMGFGARGFRFYTPVNEISFFAWAGGEVGVFAPFQIGRGADLKRRLAEAAIAGINAIRSADPRSRIVNCDPIVRVVAPRDAPWLEEEAEFFNDNYVCEGWDMLNGTKCPELGGSPQHLDIVGVNYYGVNQWEHQRHDSVLAENDPRRTAFSTLLCDLHDRYHRPMFIAETSSTGDDRPRWLADTTAECRKAMDMGVDLHGVCIYPILGMTDWHTGEYRRMGLWDNAYMSGRRDVYAPLLAVLRSLERQMNPAAAIPAYRRAEQPSASVA